jgi:hypothetical protein
MNRARYAIKSAVLTFGGKTYEMASAPVMKGETKEAVDVTALSDSTKQFIAGALKEVDEFTVTLFQAGANDITVDAEPAALTMAVTLENGEDNDVTSSVSYAKAIVTKVSPPSIDASSERKATYDVTFRPDGSAQ